MLKTSLRTEIANELMAIGATAPALMSRASVDKLYEICILTCLVKALRKMDAELIAKDKFDRSTSNLVFRLSPGTLRAPSSTPGFIYVRSRSSEYEIQNGLQVAGTSKVLHELDVSLIDRASAVKCRQNQENLTSRSVHFMMECKRYGERLDLSIGRDFNGLSGEFPIGRGKTLVSNVGSDEVLNVITKHRGTGNFSVSPLVPNSIDRFVSWLQTELEQIIK